MPIGIARGAITNKKSSFKLEDKVTKIVQTYSNLYFLTENGVLSGVGLNNSVQITGSNLVNARAIYSFERNSAGNIINTLNSTGTFIPEWGLSFFSSSPLTPNLGYIYSPIIKNNSEYNISDFDAGFTYTNNQSFQSSLFKNFCFIITKTGELYGWGFNNNLELGISSDSTDVLRLPDRDNVPSAWEWGNTEFIVKRGLLKNLQDSLQNKTVFKPTKLNNRNNWVSVVANNIGESYKHILLNSIGEIYTFGGNLNSPQKLGSNSNWKYISYNYAINNDNELYKLRDDVFPYNYTGLTKIGLNEWKTVDKHGDYAIKLNNTLWSISGTPYQIDSNADYENVFYGTAVRNSDPYDIKISSNQYFTSTDTDSVNSLSVIKPERTVINLKNYDYSTKFAGVSTNNLHGTVTTYQSQQFNGQNFKIAQPITVIY